MNQDAFDLARFVKAQDGVFDSAIAELRRGRKTGHWMWFVFPQLRGLGSSATAAHFGIGSLAEARAYLAHPVLGPRLQVAVAAVQASPAASLADLFGFPDDMKFRSSMTLFQAAAPDGPYQAALDQWSAEGPDPRTLELLEGRSMTEERRLLNRLKS
jgi:uncharacterized protein (DUF1810 family)